MYKFRKELFDKNIVPYVYRRNTFTKYEHEKITNILLSDKNINLLNRMIAMELDLDSNLSYKTRNIKIKELMNGWLNLGKLDDYTLMRKTLGCNIETTIDFINQTFVDTFKTEFKSNDIGNPFKDTKQGKLHKDLTATDYEKLNVQSYDKTFNINNQFRLKSNKIPHYQILNKGRHYERKNLSGLNASGYDKENIVYKRYGDDSFKELFKYENFNEEFRHLPTQDPDDFN